MTSEPIVKQEIGSYFHWVNPSSADSLFQKYPVKFDEEFHLFYSGRHALKYLISHIKNNRDIEKIWMPKYYCQHVTNWMKKNYGNLHFYPTPPFDYPEAFQIPEAVDGNDILIVNNYWGIGSTYIETRRENRPVIIEDHSHGWLSKQSLDSQADYCFVSLRKSLPIPLGGIAWKPGAHLPEYPLPEDSILYGVWDLMVTAMKNKTDYLYGHVNSDKNLYLSQIAKVEDGLDDSHEVIKMRPSDEKLIRNWMQLDVLAIKEPYLTFFYKKLSDSPHYQIIKRKPYCSFGLMLLFKEAKAYDSFRQHLIANQIYPSNLWPNNEEWNYFLNIHTDFRYSSDEMQYILDRINEWSIQNP